MNESLEAKLRELGFQGITDIKDAVEIFTKVRNPADLKGEFIARQYACGIDQYLCPPFRVLYNRNPEVRERVGKELGCVGVPAGVVTDYFTKFGNDPSLILAIKHETDIPADVRERFIGKAREVMLQLMQEHLGVAQLKQS